MPFVSQFAVPVSQFPFTLPFQMTALAGAGPFVMMSHTIAFAVSLESVPLKVPGSEPKPSRLIAPAPCAGAIDEYLIIGNWDGYPVIAGKEAMFTTFVLPSNVKVVTLTFVPTTGMARVKTELVMPNVSTGMAGVPTVPDTEAKVSVPAVIPKLPVPASVVFVMLPEQVTDPPTTATVPVLVPSAP